MYVGLMASAEARKRMPAGDGTSAKMPDGFSRPLPSSMRDASTVSESRFEIARCLDAGSTPNCRGRLPARALLLDEGQRALLLIDREEHDAVVADCSTRRATFPT